MSFLCNSYNYTDDAPKSQVNSQAQKNVAKRNAKANDRANDTQGDRGFSTDQRISIESMNINKKRLIHQQNETRLVGLSIQEAAIRNQIESAESRASQRCPKYNKNNVYWKRVDNLLEEQNDVVEQIKEHSRALITNDVTDSFKPEVSEFLNQNSPTKKRKETDIFDGENEPLVSDIVDEQNGYAVKKEMIEQSSKSGGVSKSKKKK